MSNATVLPDVGKVIIFLFRVKNTLKAFPAGLFDIFCTYKMANVCSFRLRIFRVKLWVFGK